LKIRVKKDDDFELEIEDDETIEALAVVIYSIRPELGEEFKLLRNGKILKPDTVVSAAGLKNGDLLLIAKIAGKPAPSNVPNAAESQVLEGTSTSPANQKTQATFDPPPRTDGDEHPSVTTNDGDLSSSPPAKYPRLEGSMDVDATSSEQVVSQTNEVVQNEQDPANSQEAPPEPVVQSSTSATAPESVQANPEPEPESAMVEESSTPTTTITDVKTADENNEKAQLEEPEVKDSEVKEPEVDASSAEGLAAFAASLENGGPTPSPAKLAELMRESASRMLVLEGAIKEFGSALQMVNVISASGLRGGLANVGSELGLGSSPKSQEEEGGRSFLIKKGDADLHELHTKAASSSPMARTTSGTTGGGAVSSVPMSKEEMDKARQARLAKLEAMQAEKQKEKDEADEKSRARDAMFSRRADLPGKTLGKQ
jgi:hypothetical protein